MKQQRGVFEVEDEWAGARIFEAITSRGSKCLEVRAPHDADPTHVQFVVEFLEEYLAEHDPPLRLLSSDAS